MGQGGVFLQPARTESRVNLSGVKKERRGTTYIGATCAKGGGQRRYWSDQNNLGNAPVKKKRGGSRVRKQRREVLI